jgi:aldose 1-epimerase
MVDGLVTLRAGALELALAPAVGGSIARFEHVAGGQRTAILRGCDGVPDHALGAGSFPLVPYVNRIRGGRFTFRGRSVTLPRNITGDASPLHGDGWLGSWEVVSSTADRATLRFAHEAGDWPWSYEAEQRFDLTERGLQLTMRCTNRSPDPMPCGLGQHPYFHCTPETRIATGVASVWTIDEHVLPVDQIPATGRFDLSDRAVCGLGLDHGFGGWSGSARLSDPSWPFALEMSSPDAHFFQLYSPVEGAIFVVEPVTHANAALNAPEDQWAELGMRVLDPGASLSLTMRLDII